VLLEDHADVVRESVRWVAQQSGRIARADSVAAAVNRPAVLTATALLAFFVGSSRLLG
jgi:hypothetical protein